MIWIILAVGLMLRLISLNQSLWLDEAINVLAVKNYSFLDLITQYIKADFHPPGWFIILWFWTKIFGYSEIAVRMPSVIFGVITIYVVFLLGKKIVSKKLGIIAAALLAVNPLHIYYSQEARMYALATLAVSINIFLFIKFLKKETNIIFLILGNILVLASDYVAYFIFPAQFIFLLLYRKDLMKKWFLMLLASVILGLWWIPVFLGQFNVGSVAIVHLPTWKFATGIFDFKAVPLTFVKFIIGRISLANKILYAVVLAPVVSLFSFLIWRGIKNINIFSRNIILFLSLVPLFLATTFSFVIPIYSYFRVLYIISPFVILISLGILSLKKLRNLFLATIISIELFCSLLYLLVPSNQREDWKGLVNFLRERNSVSTVLMESSGTLPPFDYYARGGLNAKGALKDFPAKSENELIDSSVLLDTRHIYLVNYLIDMSDPERLVEKKLTKLGYELLETKDFHGVGFLYHYVK